MNPLVRYHPSGETEGFDPTAISSEDYDRSGHSKRPLLSIIRDKCLDCCAGQLGELRKCTATACTLWPYRTGHNPFAAKREMSPEQREAAIARLAAARQQKDQS